MQLRLAAHAVQSLGPHASATSPQKAAETSIAKKAEDEMSENITN